MTSATQTLNQKVCQKYGWSCEFGRNDDDTWYADVVVGINNKRRFVCLDDKTKKGKEKVSQLALDGLRNIIEIEEAKQVKELKDVFRNQRIEILDSASCKTWERFWNQPPKVVGIDVEGNQISPPVVIQIATESYTILEVPISKRISRNLQRLLQDDNILKLFCDNFSHQDKASLGIFSSSNKHDGNKNQYLEPPIIDIECTMLQLFGPVKVPRGLSKIISLLGCLPEHNVRLEKPKFQKGKIRGRYFNIGRYARIEQGIDKPLNGLQDLTIEEQHYAALDAWCTLQAYKTIVKLTSSEEEADESYIKKKEQQPVD